VGAKENEAFKSQVIQAVCSGLDAFFEVIFRQGEREGIRTQMFAGPALAAPRARGTPA
jgi:hypothetical protein